MTISINKDEQQILVSALENKLADQYKKLINPQLDAKFVAAHQQVYKNLVDLHVKLSRYSPDVPTSVDAGRVGENAHENS